MFTANRIGSTGNLRDKFPIKDKFPSKDSKVMTIGNHIILDIIWQNKIIAVRWNDKAIVNIHFKLSVCKSC